MLMPLLRSAAAPARKRRRRTSVVSRLAVAGALAAVPVLAGACGSDEGGTGARSGSREVVVTYSILGDVVRQLVGDAADVRVVVPDGQDPHGYEPSAKDVEAIRRAALVVANGFDLEEGLASVLDEAASDGVPVFVATDHVAVRQLDAREPAGDHDDHGLEDPHLWTDPTKMGELAPDLARELERILGLDLGEQLAALDESLTRLDEQVASIMATIPEGGCRLVTGHESLGYFADRYGCTLVGAVVPSLSSSAEPSAQAIAELRDLAEEAEVGAVFTEVGTPAQVAEQIADAVGVRVVELPSHDLPDDGGYEAYLIDLATRIADALAPAPATSP